MVAAIAGVVAAGATVAGSAISASGAKSAANTQAAAADRASELQQQRYDQTRGDLLPFVQSGIAARNNLLTLFGLNDGQDPLSSVLGKAYPESAPSAPTLQAWNPTQAGLEATPGYQFTRDQGLQAVQNSFSAKGLGTSGAAMKGAADYATGLASTTYNQQFNNNLAQNSQTMGNYQNIFGNYLNNRQLYNQERSQLYSQLGGLAGSGQNAAAGLGSLALNTSNAQSALITGAGAAQAAGTVGAANAANSGLGGVASAGQGYANLQMLKQAGLLGSGGDANSSQISGLNSYVAGVPTNTNYTDVSQGIGVGAGVGGFY